MKYLVTIWLVAMYAACGAPGEKGKTMIVGEIVGADNKVVTFQNNSLRGKVDSTMTDANGQFKLVVDNMPIDFYKLSIDGQSVILAMDSTHTIGIRGDISDLKGTYMIEGSQDSQLLAEYAKRDSKFRIRKDSLASTISSKSSPPTSADMQAYSDASNANIKEYYDYLTAFVDNNSSSPAAIMASNNFEPVAELERLKKLKVDLKEVMPNSNAYLSLKKKIADAERKKQQLAQQASASAASGVGNEAPEIELNDPDGLPVALSSFRGKHVLIDFWASWCGPCRRENPNVVKMYNKYKDDGFEIYGVSLDSSKDRWLKAIADDKLTWTHVSDLAKWNSAAAKDYGVRSIPHTVLLDPDGKIMAVKLRGLQLEEKLAEIFGH